MDRIVFKYVCNNFTDNLLLSVLQSGFLPGPSMVTLITEICNFVLLFLRIKKYVMYVLSYLKPLVELGIKVYFFL